jgi:glucose/arabinose dehydrogenase
MLYVATGDTNTADGDPTRPELARDLGSMAGKILRITADGAIPPDNPVAGSPVYSYGHRNVQGLAWHPKTGDLFASEHGPSAFPGEGGLHARDEINVIKPGGDHGWPRATCAVHRADLVDPLVCWTEIAAPPSGITFRGDDLFIATLSSQALVRVGIQHSPAGYRITDLERWFASGPRQGRFGRLRDVVNGPGGALFVLTDNSALPDRREDRILKIEATSSLATGPDRPPLGR